MIILGIETSCDETAAAILEQKDGRIQILSNVVASSASLQAKYGGIIPEQAAREQLKFIIPVIEEALIQAFHPTAHFDNLTSHLSLLTSQIDAIAVTQGPGLIGSLLVGVETAKTLAQVWGKPLIPVNHLIGHFYANWIGHGSSPLRSNNKLNFSSTKRVQRAHGEVPSFPCIGLLVSGGHTDLVLFKGHGKYEYLGGTRDDAAGECFDKCARLLGLPYPGGPEISKLAAKGKDTFRLPRPMIDSDDFDFSFSGLKTAVVNVGKHLQGTVHLPGEVTDVPSDSHLGGGPTLLVNTSEVKSSMSRELNSSEVNNLATSVEDAIIEVLVTKTVRAAQMYNVEQIMVAGGVAANQRLISEFKKTIPYTLYPIPFLHVPPPYLCTDNAAMIASAAFFQKPMKNPLALQADPNLSLAY